MSIKNDDPVKWLRPCRATMYVRNVPIEVTGRFHRWADNFVEFDSGPGNYTEALVELDDGRVVSCIADSVRFLDRGAGDLGARRAVLKISVSTKPSREPRRTLSFSGSETPRAG